MGEISPFSRISAQCGLRLAGVGLTVLLNLGGSYLIGYITFVGSDSLALLNLVGMATLLSQVSIVTAFSILLHSVLLRYASIELFGRVSTIEMFTGFLFSRIGFMTFLVLFLFIFMTFLAPIESFKNLPALLALLASYFILFLWWLPTRVHPFANFPRLLNAWHKRRSLVRRAFTKNTTLFASFHSLVIVFTLGAWAGYSRAEYIESYDVDIVNLVDPRFNDAKLIFIQGDEVIFRLHSGDLLSVPDAIFVLR